MRVVDEIDNVYGSLTIVSRDLSSSPRTAARWICLCSCKRQVSVSGADLRRGRKLSCGMCSETGNTYGRLTVLGRAESKISNRHGSEWFCQCSCGNVKQLLISDLKYRSTQSCGCLAIEARQNARKHAPEDSTWIHLYRSHKGKSEDKGCLPFDLWKQIVQQNCYYCDACPRERIAKGGITVLAHGVDRFYNAIGYLPENCVPCCWVCNNAKGKMDGPEFIKHCLTIASHFKDLAQVKDKEEKE